MAQLKQCKKLRKRLEAEYELFLADIQDYFKELSISNAGKMEEAEQPVDNIEEIKKIIDKTTYIRKGSQRPDSPMPDRSAQPYGTKNDIACIKKYLEILEKNSLIASCWKDLNLSGRSCNLTKKIENYKILIGDKKQMNETNRDAISL